LVKIK